MEASKTSRESLIYNRQNGFLVWQPLAIIPTVRMASNYQYSIKVNEALESYGARTSGDLARRVERLKRFTDLKNKRYANDLRLEHARMVANQEREERTRNRVREVVLSGTGKSGQQSVVRNLENELQQEVPRHDYNLRSREEENGLHLLWRAIQNGFVNVNRG